MAKRDSTTEEREDRNSDSLGSLKDIIERERARLMAAHSVLGCARVALNNGDAPDLHALDYADVIEVARDLIRETTVQLDSAYLQRFYRRIPPGD